MPVAALAEFLADFPLDEQAHIGESSIRKAKDAFCAMVLDFNREGVRRSMQSLAAEAGAEAQHVLVGSHS